MAIKHLAVSVLKSLALCKNAQAIASHKELSFLALLCFFSWRACVTSDLSSEREVWSHKNSDLWKYGIGQHIEKEQDEKSSPAKDQPVSSNWWGDISTDFLWWLHTNPSKIGLDRSLLPNNGPLSWILTMIWAYLRWIYMESLEHDVAYLHQQVDF